MEPRPSTAPWWRRDAPVAHQPPGLFAWRWAILRSCCCCSFPVYLGRAPRLEKRRKPAALKARFTFWASSMHDLTLCPNPSVKAFFTLFLAPRIASLGAIQRRGRPVETIVCHQILPQNVGIATTLENSLYSIVNQELRLIDAKSSVGTPYVSQRTDRMVFGNVNSKLLINNDLHVSSSSWHPWCL